MTNSWKGWALKWNKIARSARALQKHDMLFFYPKVLCTYFCFFGAWKSLTKDLLATKGVDIDQLLIWRDRVLWIGIPLQSCSHSSHGLVAIWKGGATYPRVRLLILMRYVFLPVIDIIISHWFGSSGTPMPPSQSACIPKCLRMIQYCNFSALARFPWRGLRIWWTARA